MRAFSASDDRLGTPAAGFAADVRYRAARLHFRRGSLGRARIEMEPAVSKRIGSHVEDAHHESTRAEMERAPTWQLKDAVSAGSHS